MPKDTMPNMHISEITPEATISVIGTLDNKKMELPTEYAHLTPDEANELDIKFGEGYLPLESILQYWQDRLMEVSFKGHESKIDLIAITKNGLYRWENISVRKYELSTGKSVHIVTAPNHYGSKYNRRRGVRIKIDRVMNVEQDDNMYSVIVKDLSYCGVAFTEPLGAQLDSKRPFILHLVENGDDGEVLIGKFACEIRNQKEEESGAVTSGCIIYADHAPFLQRYIANKQIEEIRGKKVDPLTKNSYSKEWKRDVAEAFDYSSKMQ